MGGCVFVYAGTPLEEATETLMPELMDMDSVRYLFETRMRVRGNFDVRGAACGCLRSEYQLEERDAR